ncbi:MAG: TlpA family protein disulfide reductase [Bacteroidetes bacterium]|nr:TlpA family protein disulfide reductase [Bacteroidota bacterium]
MRIFSLKEYLITMMVLSSFILACIKAQSQSVPIIKFHSLNSILQSTADTTYVINFWATWCKPCVAELPAFVALDHAYKNKNVKVILVSLDFKRQYEERLLPFVKNKHIAPLVMLLDEPDYNSWIDKVDSTWSGAIPASLIINGKKGIRKFYEKEFTFDELKKEVEQVCNTQK